MIKGTRLSSLLAHVNGNGQALFILYEKLSDVKLEKGSVLYLNKIKAIWNVENGLRGGTFLIQIFLSNFNF